MAVDLAAKLKQKRTGSAMSMTSVAAFLGVEVSTYSRWEKGETQPRFEHRLKLAELFQVQVAWLQADKEMAPTGSNPAEAA